MSSKYRITAKSLALCGHTPEVDGEYLELLELQIEWFETDSFCNENTTIVLYYTRLSDLFVANNHLILNSFYLTDAVVSNVSLVNIYIDSKTLFQLIPCLLFPIVTFLLIREVRNIEQNRRRMLSSNKLTDSKKATRFVLYFTLTFSNAQFPLGLTSSVLYLFEETPGISTIIYYLYNLLSMLFAASTVTHFIVCMLMPSQYRNTVKFKAELRPDMPYRKLHNILWMHTKTSLKFQI
ncbi:hypothetical protein CRE_08959 [Caenorhabditis remanei]|uniref:G-protein coupled receptors family 1 profile domain-containing protein n=1 Tax=Caenorhabditis remanei TaxID=31234 RepID=E3LIH2_CAERE|nr:hypothetical protein CRE_08959 [Caenorhabditis remanei]